MPQLERLTIIRPDDWHLHLRDGDVMAAVLPYSARHFARAIIMPNLVPPVTTTAMARAYHGRILAALGPDADFEALMTCYLTDTTDATDLIEGFKSGVLTAAKLYPAGATTNSDSGVTAIEKIQTVLEAMAEAGMPLLMHGEVTDGAVDIFDREAVFIERVLDPLRRKIPSLKIVFEHITTSQAVKYVQDAQAGLGATITPHHLAINRNAMLAGGIRPQLYCLPILKRETHREALFAVAISGDKRFFLGTDSAPHLRRLKETECGCAGVFNAPTTLAVLAHLFEEAGALDKLEGFVSLNGAAFYGRAPNQTTITLEKHDGAADGPPPAVTVPGERDDIAVFHLEEGTPWRVVES